MHSSADAAPLFEEDLEQNEEENIDTKLLDIIDGVTGDKSRERFATKNKSKSNSIHRLKQIKVEKKEVAQTALKKIRFKGTCCPVRRKKYKRFKG